MRTTGVEPTAFTLVDSMTNACQQRSAPVVRPLSNGCTVWCVYVSVLECSFRYGGAHVLFAVSERSAATPNLEHAYVAQAPTTDKSSALCRNRSVYDFHMNHEDGNFVSDSSSSRCRIARTPECKCTQGRAAAVSARRYTSTGRAPDLNNLHALRRPCSICTVARTEYI